MQACHSLVFGVLDLQEDLGRLTTGKEAIGGERQFLEISLCVVPQLLSDVIQSRAVTPSHNSATLLEEGGKKCLQAFSQEAWLCIFCQSVVHMAAPKPCQHAWPLLGKTWKLQKLLVSLSWKMEPIQRGCCFPK